MPSSNGCGSFREIPMLLYCLTVQCEKDVEMGLCLYVGLCFSGVILTLFAYFLTCHPYIFLLS